MPEYIDRAVTVSQANFIHGRWDDVYVSAATLMAMPAADVAPIVHGWWIERRAPHAMGGISAKCSACNKSVQYLGNPLNYCPHCGAKMDGGVKNDD